MDLNDARRLAEGMMAEHGLRGWTFDFDRAVRRIGVCKGDRRLITLSRVRVERMGEDEVRQVMLHEIAHALTPKDEGHGQQWKAKAAEIGYRGERLATTEFDKTVYEKSAARWRANNGGEKHITPPLRVGGRLFLKGAIYEIQKINPKNVVCRRIKPLDTKYVHHIRKWIAELAMVS